jgi:glutathionylspermidine synthase
LDPRIKNLDLAILHDAGFRTGLFEELRGAQRKLGLLHGERITCPFLRPHIVSRVQYDSIKRAAETIAGAFEKLAQEALRNPEVLRLLGLTPLEEEMARIEPGYTRLAISSRLDSYVTTTGFHFLEYNAETPAGVGDQMQLEKLLLGLPPLQHFLERNDHWLPKPHETLLRSLISTYREWGGEEEPPQIAIVDWDNVPTASEFRVLRDYFVQSGFATVIADPHDLHYDGKYLSIDGFRIDVLYKRVIIHELLDKFDREHPLIKAYRDGHLCMANSFRSKLAHKKSGFVVLTDPAYQDLFETNELEVIQKHIPWTRYVSNSSTSYHGAEYDLVSLIRTEQNRFVLKPNDDYGGHGVFLGWEVDAATWEDALQLALQKPYVVQERVDVEKTSIPAFSDRISVDEMFVDFNPFLFQNEVEGALIRLSSSSLLNVSSGGGQTALLVLEDA